MKRTLALTMAAALFAVLVQSPAQAKANGPEIFAPGAVSTGIEEWRIVFDPNGNTAYFGRGEEFFPFSRQATIMETKRVNGSWQAATPASFSGTYSDIDPFITPDGKTLMFSSIRPVNGAERSDVDLWLVRRQPDGSWGQAQHMGDNVNSPYDDLFPSAAADGTLYFASDRPGGVGGYDMWRSRLQADGTYGPAENLGTPVNTDGWEFNPVILPSGNVLLFTGLERAGGYGLGDIWVSFLVGGTWTTPRNIGPALNTAADEYNLSFSPRYDKVYFVRHTYEPWVPGDIYMMPTWKLLSR